MVLADVAMRVYTFRSMARRAKIFRNGGSQAVRLPKSCRFPDDQHEVVVRKVGKRIILEPADEWGEDFLAVLGAWDQEIERPTSAPISKKKGSFD